MWFHLTARYRCAKAPFQTWKICAWLWAELRREFPRVVGTVLMPDHLHILAQAPGGEAAQARLRAILAQLSRVHGLGERAWETPPPPTAIPDEHHLRRQVRYVSLNPCRKGLCRDPLEWVWSTHRDVVGAVADPWTTSAALAGDLRLPPRDIGNRHHAYVSADPSVDPRGTPPPSPAPSRDAPEIGLRSIADAAVSAVRGGPESWRSHGPARDLFVELAVHQGWRNLSVLARLLGMTPQGVRMIARHSRTGLEAAALCLGDARLRTHRPDGASEAAGLLTPAPARSSAR